MHFARVRALLLALFVFSFALPLSADEPKPAKAKDADKAAKDKEAKEKREKYVRVGTLMGTLQKKNETSGEITVRVTWRYLQPNQGAQANLMRQQQQLMQRQMAIMNIRNPIQRQQQLLQLNMAAMRLQANPGNLFTVKETQQNVDLVLAEDALVRSAHPPEAFDDKGNVKRYTAKELKELRGDPKLPGYPAERESLEVGRVVMVRVARLRGAAPVRGGKGKRKGKDDPAEDKAGALDKDAPGGNKPLVTLILIGPEPMQKK